MSYLLPMPKHLLLSPITGVILISRAPNSVSLGVQAPAFLQNNSLIVSQQLATREYITAMDTIPEEILIQIVKRVPHHSLPALALTCRRIHNCAVPELYRFVEIQGKGQPQRYFYGLPPSLSSSRNSDSRTRVNDLMLFVRTIEESEHLRSFIHGVALQSKWCINLSLKSSGNIIALLEPHLQYIHSTHPIPPNDDLPKIPFVSIHIPFKSAVLGQPVVADGSRFADYLQKLRELFSCPNVRSLSIPHFDFDFVSDALSTSDHSTRYSTVSSLSFKQAHFRYNRIDGFAEIVSWPKSLQVLQISLFQRYNPRGTALELSPSAESMIAALALHQATLKELLIRKPESSSNIAVSVLNLQQFSNLTILGLRQCDLAISPSPSQEATASTVETPVPKWQILPPKLERLQIEVTNSNWDIQLNGRSLIPNLAAAVPFGDWLKALAPHKHRCCPALWNCVVWDWRMGSRIDNQLYREWLESLGVGEALEEAGIRLDATTNSIPPLLSLGLKDQD